MNRKLFRPSLTEMKDPQMQPQMQRPQQQHSGGSHPSAPRRKPAPPELTSAEAFYYVKQMQSRTPVAVVLNDGEVLNGAVEWYDRDCIKLTRVGSPNVLIYKQVIKYIYKTGEDASQGGNGNGSN